jgi:type II secretory pathway component GspD/PulD (secretin)
MRAAAALLAVLLLPVAAAAAPMQLEVIPLRHRTADDLIPVLRPLLAPGATLTGMNDQLIVKTTPENLAQIREVLDSLDRRLRRLLITVRQDGASGYKEREQSLSGRVGSGDITVESRDPRRDRNGAGVTVGRPDGDHVRYGVLDREGGGTHGNTSSVQTLEGREAFIQTGLSVPVPQQNVIVGPGSIVVQDAVHYRDATTGFWVLPRLAGEYVTLLVSPFMSSVHGGRTPVFDVQNVETTVSGRLGEWIALGGIDGARRRDARESFSSGRHESYEERNILIKVEELP